MSFAVTDFSQYAALRRGAERHDPEALRAVAQQFEALFIETMLASARDASLAEPIFGNSDQHAMYRELLDRQWSVEMARGPGIGLADLLVRRLGGGAEDARAAAVSAPGRFRLPASAGAAAPGDSVSQPGWSSPAAFARDVWPHAVRAAQKLNVAPEAILAQAALESGWGRRVPETADGGSSFNLFGIKAGSDWRGKSVSRPTVEYADGIARHEQAHFRAYSGLAATFADYVDLLASHPRYAEVRNQGQDVEGFASALQDAGYATDPAYAEKISRVAGSEVLKDALDALNFSAPPPIADLRR